MKFYRFIGLVLFFTLNIYAQNYKELAIKNRKGLLNKILTNKEIVVGVQKNHLPYTTENIRYPGIDVEIIQLLCKYLEINYKLVYGNIDELIIWTSNKQVDLSFGGVSTDIQRSLAVNFSYPYLITTPAGILNKAKLPRESLAIDFPKTKIQNIGDIVQLPKLKIAIKENTIYQTLLQENTEFLRHEIIVYKTNQDALDSVLNGENDLFISDLILIKAYAIKNPTITEQFHLILDTYIQEYVSIMIPPDEIELLLFINTFIKQIEINGKLKAIVSKYLESRNWLSQ
ncbi:MAG: transporter substrate-binding domain-containing protein [Leptospiraceae bacterium]|jgi:polar amino acid transport system substrate-binding protein|nr:transporter substrate-binding domain-containing protein [Leptospiraceae bacterium]